MLKLYATYMMMAAHSGSITSKATDTCLVLPLPLPLTPYNNCLEQPTETAGMNQQLAETA